MSDQNNPDESYFREAHALYIIDGQKYRVPMGYHWFVHIKHHGWPSPKDAYSEVPSFTADALLPNFSMYSSATRSEFDNTVGNGNIVSVTVSSMERRNKPLEELMAMWKAGSRLQELPSNVEAPELRPYLEKGYKDASESMWREVYIPDNNANDFWIECSKGRPSDNCSAYELLDRDVGPVVHTTYSKKYLSSWKAIREQTHKLLGAFKASTESLSNSRTRGSACLVGQILRNSKSHTFVGL